MIIKQTKSLFRFLINVITTQSKCKYVTRRLIFECSHSSKNKISGNIVKSPIIHWIQVQLTLVYQYCDLTSKIAMETIKTLSSINKIIAQCHKHDIDHWIIYFDACFGNLFHISTYSMKTCRYVKETISLQEKGNMNTFFSR